MKGTPVILTAALLTLSLLLPVSAAAAEVYKWVDEDGVLHYSAQPPSNQAAATVDTPDSPARPSPAAAENTDSSASGRKATPEDIAEATRPETQPEPTAQQVADEPELTAEEQVAECQQARQVIQQVEPRTRVIVTDSEGESRRLTDSERLSLLEEKRAYIAENC